MRFINGGPRVAVFASARSFTQASDDRAEMVVQRRISDGISSPSC